MKRGLFALLVCATCELRAGASAGASVPLLPEFFGTYAVVEGGLHGIDVGVSTVSPEVFPVLVCRTEGELEAGLGVSVSVPVFSSDVEFLVFTQDAALQTARELLLYRLPFIRTMTIHADSDHYRKTYSTNSWVSATDFGYAGVGEELVPLLHKPVAGQDDMVLAVASEPLPPGLYRVGDARRAFFFAVSPVEASVPARCVDAAKRTAFGAWVVHPCGTSGSGGEEEVYRGEVEGGRQRANVDPGALSITEGVALFPDGAASGEAILGAFRKAMVDAGYTLERQDDASVDSFLIVEPKKRILRDLMKGIGEAVRFTWSVTVLDLGSRGVEVLMRRSSSQAGLVFTDVAPLFRYICEQLDINPGDVSLTIGELEGQLTAF